MLHPEEVVAALFGKLAPPLARALASHLGLPRVSQVPSATLPTLLSASSSALRTRCRRELSPVAEVAHVVDRAELMALATQRFSITRPDWPRLLRNETNQEIAVRLYLESPAAFLHAHRPLLLARPGELSTERADYIADVVPSRDRLRRMQDTLARLDQQLGHASSRSHSFADEHQLAMWTASEARPFGRRAFSFFFETGVLCVRAATRLERSRICASFADIFAGDARYFRASQRARSKEQDATYAALSLCALGGDSLKLRPVRN